MSDTLPPGVLPNITNTDPPQMHPSTVVGDGYVGAPPFCEDTPHVLYDGTTLTCTMGNWVSNPDTYAYQWQLDGADVPGATNPSYVVQSGDSGVATCIVTATNDYGSTVAPPSNEVPIPSIGTDWVPPGQRPDGPGNKPPEQHHERQEGRSAQEPKSDHEPESHPDHPEHQGWLERARRHSHQERAGRHE